MIIVKNVKIIGVVVMIKKILAKIFKPVILINAFKILTEKNEMSETQKRIAYAVAYGSDMMEYKRDDLE